MTRHLRLVALATVSSAGLAGLFATTAAGQTRLVAAKPSTAQPAIVSVEIEDVNVRQAMYSVRSDLRQLVIAQETFWRSRRTYAPDVTYLPMFHSGAGVQVQIQRARSDGWAARAAYSDGLGAPRSCVIWVGDIAPAERPVTDIEHKVYPEAEVSCDGDGFTTKGEWAAAGRTYMNYALRKLALSQSRFFAFHRRFTTDESALDPFVWDRDVAVTISEATPTGWVAHATFASVPGRSCVIWHGAVASAPSTAAEHLSGADSQVVCD